MAAASPDVGRLMNFLTRLLAYKAAREMMREPSADRQLAGGFIVGFLAVVCGLVLLGGLIELLT